MRTQTRTAPVVLIHCPRCTEVCRCASEAEAIDAITRHIVAAHVPVASVRVH